MKPFEALANAIAIQAVKDYRSALRRLMKNPRNIKAEHMKNDCESFFRSSWYALLTPVDGQLLMSKLRMEVGA